MGTKWAKEEIESVLIQLDNQFYPFKNYRFAKEQDGLVLLGKGGFANVYEMERVNNPNKKFAIKVIGFAEGYVNSEEFLSTVQIQNKLAIKHKNVVSVIDYMELCVHIDDEYQVTDVIETSGRKPVGYGFPRENTLKLQFILMEKMIPVLTRDKKGAPKLQPESLANFEQDEIIKFAHDIGATLEYMHENNLLHRDIKLENVFYDSKKKVYKLGDFGIAKLTADGTANTTAFTRGYGAPEVICTTEERYDNTADIYSYGMMLYLLLNELKFPDSKSYNVSSTLQYTKGYMFPRPEWGEFRLWPIVEKMCRYNPDERYQSMENVMNDIEIAKLGEATRYKHENTKSAYVAGMLCYVMGMILWKLTHMPEMTMEMDFGAYIFLIAGGWIYWLNLKRKKHYFISIATLGLGIYLLISTGFNWWKFLCILGVAFSGGSFSGLVCMGVIIVDVLSRIILKNPQIYMDMQPYNWTSLLFLSFSFVLLIQYKAFKERDIRVSTIDVRKNIYWIIVVGVYVIVLINGLQQKYMGISITHIEWLDQFNYYVYKFRDYYNCIWLGMGGLVLSGGWLIRENVLKRIK